MSTPYLRRPVSVFKPVFSHINNRVKAAPQFNNTTATLLFGLNRLNKTTPQSFRTYCSFHRRAESSYTMAGNRLLLPDNVTPLHYDLTLHPDLEKYTYTGSVGIDFQVNKASDFLTVHSVDLEVKNVELSTGEKPIDTARNDDEETYTYKFDQQFKEGSKVTLKVDFDGILNDKLCGFYRSVHKDDDGKTKVVATTQMEPCDARRAFVCADEPSLKSTYDISLICEKDLTALSNCDVKEVTELEGGLKKTVFNTTPKMSTYLVAFIVGDLSYVENTSFRVPVRAYATPGLETKCQYAVDLAAKALEFYEQRFDIAYPLPKMDMVAIHDFSAGAMENWGLVTYRVVDLIYEGDDKGSASQLHRVSEVILHELAHQWFGNLVTMDWWEGLWLNEGFATAMSWLACNHFKPSWKVYETFVANDLQASLKLDGLRSSHPIEVPIERSDQVNQIFDSISYAKGSSVIRMISTWLGEETFLKGVSNYLKKHAYGNTKTEDLWDALTEVSGKDVAGIMGVWTKEVGYPVLTVKEQGDSITVTQNRYLTTGDVKPEDDKTIYPVNLAVRSKKEVSEVMLNDREMTLKVDPEFYKLNAQHNGIYRVLYPMDRIQKLGQAGAQGLMTTEDRIGLIADVAALGSSGYQKTSAFLQLAYEWKNETECNVWGEMLGHLALLRTVWKQQPEEVKEALKKYQASLAVEKCKQVGYTFSENDGLLLQQLKGHLYGAAVGSEDKEFVNHALELFKKYDAGDEKAFNANLRGAVFGAAAKYGDESIYDKFVAIYNKGSVEGNTAIRCLGRCKLESVRRKTLEAALNGTVRSQDIFYVLNGFNVDAEGSAMIWQWMQDNWDTILEKFPPTTGMLGHIVEICASGLVQKDGVAQVEKFFEGKSTKGFDKSLNIVKDRISSRLSWLERDVEDVNAWLKQNKFL